MMTLRKDNTLRTSLAAFGCLIALLGLPRPGSAASITFTTSSTSISGTTGSTIGFGYTIVNNTNDYFQATDLNAGSFTVGTANSIFDFPEVAPSATVSEVFTTVASAACPTPDCGLFEITLTGAAGQSNSGSFDLSGELYSDQAETMDVGPVTPDLMASYTVSVVSSATVTPEPSYTVFIAFLFAGWLFSKRSLRLLISNDRAR